MRLSFTWILCVAVLFAAPVKAAPIKPTGDGDHAVALRSKLAILADPQISGFDIQVQAKNGFVTASGIVDTEIQRRLLQNVLRSVPGVREVELNVQLNPDTSRGPTVIRLPAPNRMKDEDIASKVRVALAGDRMLVRSPMEVLVVRRMVRLTGTVPSESVILHAAQIARGVPGVLAVDARSLSTREMEARSTPAQSPARGLEMSQLSPSETRELQRALMLAGIYKGAPDGVWNDLTEKALITYQARYNLPITGRVDPATVRALHLKISTEGRQSELAPPPRGGQARVRVISDQPSVMVITASDVKAVQQALGNRGYYGGPLAGRIDENTRAALRAFQRASKLAVTGNIDQSTINALGLSIDLSRRELMQ